MLKSKSPFFFFFFVLHRVQNGLQFPWIFTGQTKMKPGKPQISTHISTETKASPRIKQQVSGFLLIGIQQHFPKPKKLMSLFKK